jgi:hypothetical protein
MEIDPHWLRHGCAVELYGPAHPNVAVFANNLGQILQAKGDLEGGSGWDAFVEMLAAV